MQPFNDPLDARNSTGKGNTVHLLAEALLEKDAITAMPLTYVRIRSTHVNAQQRLQARA